MNWKQVSVTEGEQKLVFVNIQQMFIGGNQQRDSRQRSLGENLAIVLFGFGISAASVNRAANRVAIASCVPDRANGWHFQIVIFSERRLQFVPAASLLTRRKSAVLQQPLGARTANNPGWKIPP